MSRDKRPSPSPEALSAAVDLLNYADEKTQDQAALIIDAAFAAVREKVEALDALEANAVRNKATKAGQFVLDAIRAALEKR